jgi:protein-disulfide isomerase
MTLFSRRGALAVAGTTIALTLGAGIPSAAVAQTSPGLPDLVYGKAEAPVVIEEYASLTCGHCGAFYTNVLPHLQKTYIDTGKVRFVYRDFPLDDLAVGAAMLARCSKDKRGAMIGALYKTQATWLSDKANPLEELYKVGRQFGMKQDEMEKCLADEAAAKAILTDAEAFEKAVKIEGTPTFMVNGKKFDKAPTIEGFDAYLKPLVK